MGFGLVASGAGEVIQGEALTPLPRWQAHARQAGVDTIPPSLKTPGRHEAASQPTVSSSLRNRLFVWSQYVLPKRALTVFAGAVAGCAWAVRSRKRSFAASCAATAST